MPFESVEPDWDRGVDHLRRHEWAEAAAIGRSLVEQGDPRGHELLAGALQGSGDPEAAAAESESAVQAFPESRRLWVMAGNFRSDRGDYTASHEAFETALRCPEEGLDDGFIWLNMAVLLHREHRFVEAHQTLDRIDDTDDEQTRLRVHEVRFRIWNAEGRYDEVLSVGEALMETVDGESDHETVSWILLHIAEALIAGLGDADTARHTAIAGLQWSGGAQPGLLEIVRRIDDRRNETAKLFRITVEGELSEPDEHGEELGYFAVYQVAAESPAQALEMIRALEHESLRESLRISEAETLDEHWVGLLGVYSVGDRCSFPADAPDEEG